MSPEAHERAVEIFETKNGVEYSDQVENTPEWADAVDAAIDELPDATAADLIVDEYIALRAAADRVSARPLAIAGKTIVLDLKSDYIAELSRLGGLPLTIGAGRTLDMLAGYRDTSEFRAIRRCTSCGCTEARACPGGCWWISDGQDLCSACAPTQTRGQR